MVMDHTPQVRFESIRKHYPGVVALDDVSFSIASGSIHALVGENGAGKSTLIKILGGAVAADGGTIRLNDQLVRIANARHAQSLGIAVVHQEFSLAPDLGAGENVFLGHWPRSRYGLVSYSELFAQTEALFGVLAVSIPPRARVADLSVAQQQMVEIARALALQARVLVLDEPSAVLTPSELTALFAFLRRLAGRGVSIVYISHRLEEVFELCDQVTVLRDGRHISTRPMTEANRETLIREMVGRAIEEEFPARKPAFGEPALVVRGLSARGRFESISFEIRAGEILGLTGLVGSGRSSVGLGLYGSIAATRGTVQVGDASGPFHGPCYAQRAGIAYVPEDRKRQGLLLQRPIRENISLANLSGISRRGWLRLKKERTDAAQAMENLRIKAANSYASVATLSGGNQQKTLFARWMHKPYRVIILDEPTRGVDVGARVEIYALMNRMASQGAAILLITSELGEAIGMADRVAVMREGRMVAVLDNTDRKLTQQTIMRNIMSDPVSVFSGTIAHPRRG